MPDSVTSNVRHDKLGQHEVLSCHTCQCLELQVSSAARKSPAVFSRHCRANLDLVTTRTVPDWSTQTVEQDALCIPAARLWATFGRSFHDERPRRGGDERHYHSGQHLLLPRGSNSAICMLNAYLHSVCRRRCSWCSAEPYWELRWGGYSISAGGPAYI